MGKCSCCTRRWPYIKECIKCPPRGFCACKKKPFCPPKCCPQNKTRKDDHMPGRSDFNYRRTISRDDMEICHEPECPPEDPCTCQEEENPCCPVCPPCSCPCPDDGTNIYDPCCQPTSQCCTDPGFEQVTESYSDLTDDQFFYDYRYTGFLKRSLYALFGDGICEGLKDRNCELQASVIGSMNSTRTELGDLTHLI
jgi:hypothetical protein